MVKIFIPKGGPVPVFTCIADQVQPPTEQNSRADTSELPRRRGSPMPFIRYDFTPDRTVSLCPNTTCTPQQDYLSLGD